VPLPKPRNPKDPLPSRAARKSLDHPKANYLQKSPVDRAIFVLDKLALKTFAAMWRSFVVERRTLRKRTRQFGLPRLLIRTMIYSAIHTPCCEEIFLKHVCPANDYGKINGRPGRNRCRFGRRSPTDSYRTLDVRRGTSGVLRPGNLPARSGRRHENPRLSQFCLPTVIPLKI
jgi:hypothetical protein